MASSPGVTAAGTERENGGCNCCIISAAERVALDVAAAAGSALAWFATIVRVHLGDGTIRVKAGERLEHAETACVPRETDEDTSSHPRYVAPGKEWITVEGSYPLMEEIFIVEIRTVLQGRNLEDAVVVFLHGVSFPTREVLSVVNNAHAVLVLRGTNDYFYLRDDFVMSANEELALVEWGVGPPLFANSLLAVGGTALVAFVEEVWGPAVLGILLVAASEYRVQGVMTKLLRTRSPEWKSNCKLVPSGVHGTERVVQGVLVTLLALADLLDDRWLLLAALTLASVQRKTRDMGQQTMVLARQARDVVGQQPAPSHPCVV
eukprot:g13861.t1